jgi:hypothetical protein
MDNICSPCWRTIARRAASVDLALAAVRTLLFERRGPWQAVNPRSWAIDLAPIAGLSATTCLSIRSVRRASCCAYPATQFSGVNAFPHQRSDTGVKPRSEARRWRIFYLSFSPCGGKAR